jgi:hypothetical protein
MMMFWRSPALPFAGHNGVDELAARMSDGFRSDRTSVDIGTIVALLAGAAGIGFLLWIVAHLVGGYDRRATFNSPRKLFLRLCRAHRLTWRDTWLLWRLARSQRLGDPARLFLEPERFDPSDLAPGLRRHAERLQSLRDRLFADLSDLVAA